MEDVELKVETRENSGTRWAKRARKKGLVPCILYGLEKDNMSLTIPRNSLEAFLRSHKKMVDLCIGESKETTVLKDLQFDPITDHVIHADFERVAMDEEIEIEIAIVLEGNAKGLENNGMVDQPLKSLQISCLPRDIPEEITVDVTELEVNDSLKVADIKTPHGVTVTTNPDEVVVVIHRPMEEEEVVPTDEEAAAEPEVITAAPPEGEEAEPQETKEKEPKDQAEKKES